MPNASEILTSLEFLANKYFWLAMVWHIIILIVVIFSTYSKKPNAKIYFGTCGLLFLSVSMMAAMVTNIFNLIVFLALALVFIKKSVTTASSQLYLIQPVVNRILSYILILSGLIYPHFLGPEMLMYIVAAPVGIIPCPTLLVTSGITLMFSMPNKKLTYLLAGANIFYGMIGVFFLGVTLDVLLLLTAIIQLFQLNLNKRVQF
jgi:hypothetical protein